MRCPTGEKEETENGRKEVEEPEMEDVGDVARVESLLRRLEGARMETSDRVELIERIKRGESPTWVPGRAVSGYSLPFYEWLLRLDSWRAPAYVEMLGVLQRLLKKLATRHQYLSGVLYCSLLGPTVSLALRRSRSRPIVLDLLLVMETLLIRSFPDSSRTTSPIIAIRLSHEFQNCNDKAVAPPYYLPLK